MKIIRTFVEHSLGNYNYLITCPQTQQTAAVDPHNAEHLLQVAQRHQLDIHQIWMTHEHHDHVKGLSQLQRLTQAKVFAPISCRHLFNADIWLKDQALFKLGQATIEHWLVPGHTLGHGVFVYQRDPQPQSNSFIVSGDTLFNAGVGNTHAGDTHLLYRSIKHLNQRISGYCKLLPGHDLLINNLSFVLHYFPKCKAASQALDRAKPDDVHTRSLITIAEERLYNPFLNLDAPWLIDNPNFTSLSPLQRFTLLRELRNQW